MALIQCPECGREISDAAEACPHCGYPVLQNSNKLPKILETDVLHTETDVAGSKQKRKKFIAICTVAAIAIIGIITGVVVHKNNIAKQAAAEAAKEYKENIGLAIDTMLSGASEAETCCGLIHDVWYNTIYEKSDSTTNPFTQWSSGRFNSDFNDSLRKLFRDDDFISQTDEIKNNQAVVEDLMKKLANPPDDFQDAYDAVWNLYEVYLDLTNMAINPTGNLQNYTQNYNTADTDFLKYFKAARVYTD